MNRVKYTTSLTFPSKPKKLFYNTAKPVSLSLQNLNYLKILEITY